MPRFLIVGAGPTGLGAAWRLAELGHDDWMLLEAGDVPGGLSSSFVDDRGFTWDLGVHVLHSHYEYFDAVMDELLGPDGWREHERRSSIFMRERFIPYPLQHNLHHLPSADVERCLAGLIDVARTPARVPENFREWLLATFGRGIAETFLFPYNRKAWAHPPELLNADWVGDRVAVTDLERVVRNLARREDDVSWGPNSRFRFPARGGTGEIWKACARRLPRQRLGFGRRVVAVDLDRRAVTTAGGDVIPYDHLISSLPLRDLIRVSGQRQLQAAADRGLLFSSSHIVGVGLAGTLPERLAGRSWIYFPEDHCPFHRLTVFSSFSQGTVPSHAPHWSLIAEVAESSYRPVAPHAVLEQVLAGLLATGMIGDRRSVVSTWHVRQPYGYPVPGLERDDALAEILPVFENGGVYSRGRFGLWKYEVSNQDHSFMQGVEIVERLVHGRPEITAADAAHANGTKHPWLFERWRDGDRRPHARHG